MLIKDFSQQKNLKKVKKKVKKDSEKRAQCQNLNLVPNR